MEQQVKRNDRHLSNRRDLWKQLIIEWLQIDVNITKRFIHSMPRRTSAVIRAKGWLKILIYTFAWT